MKKALPIILGVIDVILLGVIIVSAATGWRIGSAQPTAAKPTDAPTIAATESVSENDRATEGSTDSTQPTEKPTEKATEKATQKATEKPTDKPTEKPTAKPTEKATAKPTEKPAKLPYEESLGKPEATDFVWLVEAANGERPSGAKDLGKDDILGKWKGEFMFDGIWEMVYITIDRDGGITAQPYQINYGGGWEDESSNDPYVFSGSFSDGGVSGSGKYGKMSLNSFYEIDGTQYGVGKFTVEYSGDTVPVGLIRP